MNPNITFLGPLLGTTFSSEAYEKYAQVFNAPAVNKDNYLPAKSNENVLDMVIDHGGYGVIAMDTEASGRVDESLRSFIRLLQRYENPSNCPIEVFGAVKLRTCFALMSAHEEGDEPIETIVAHKKALLACKKNIALLEKTNGRAILLVEADSNGEAAEIVMGGDYPRSAVLAPAFARDQYKYLFVCEEAFEDNPTRTLFFFIGPKGHPIIQREEYCALAVFELQNVPGAIANAIQPFAEEGISIGALQSIRVKGEEHHFAFGVECNANRLVSLKKALESFKVWTKRTISFGPFPLIHR